MPTQTNTIIKPTDRFADFHSLFTFPKGCITSKMIQLTNHEEAFLVSCLKSDPLVFIKNYKMIRPIYQKNDLIPLKPLQRLNSFAELNGSLIISHGDHSMEYGRISAGDEGGFVISRFSQKTIEKPYKKILFASEDAFYAKNDTQIDFYDFKRSSRTCRIDSRNVVQDFDLCPGESNIFGYTDGFYLNVIDSRAKVSKSTLYKHKSGGNQVRWNPIVPYWLATTTADSIDIFDIRYNSSFPVKSIQHGNVHELSWSPSDCDLILAASRDRRTNLWSLRHSEADCRLNMTMNRFDLGSLTAGRLSGFYYGLDDADSLIKIKIRPEYLAAIAPTVNDDEIYCPDFDNFKMKVLEMSREAQKESDYTKLKQFILMATVASDKSSRKVDFDQKIVSSIESKGNFADFNELLAQNTAKPTSGHLNFNHNADFQKFIDKFRLKIRVIELISSDDFGTLRKLLNLVTAALCDDFDLFEPEESTKFLAFLLKNDRRCALEILTQICAAFPIGTPKILQIWIWMAVYPTIFDEKSFELIKIRPSLSKSITKCDIEEDDYEIYIQKLRNHFYNSYLFSDPQQDEQIFSPQNMKIIQQIYLNLCGNGGNDIEKVLQVELKLLDLDAEVVKEYFDAILREKESISIISAHFIKKLLEKTFSSQAKTNYLSDFFLLAFRLQILTERTPINDGIREFVNTVAFSRLKFLLSSAAKSNKSSAHSTSSTASAINSIVTIGTDCYCTFSEDQMKFLAEQLRNFVEDLEDFSEVDGNFSIESGSLPKEFKNELKNLKNKI